MIADALEDVEGLPFPDRLIFCKAPVNTRQSMAVAQLVHVRLSI